MRIVAIVVAAGDSRRLKSKVRKSFIPLGGRPMLTWTLRAFEETPRVGEVILVAHRSDLQAARNLVRSQRFRKVLRVVRGGGSRMASVSCGLKAVEGRAKWVIVHDGARPLVTPGLIRKTLSAARRSGAAIVAVPVVPTIKEAKNKWVTATLDRSHLWEVQTPQVFRRDLLERAHRQGKVNGRGATDDAVLVERLGCRVRIVPGSSGNLKITTPEDLFVAEALLKHARRDGV